MDSNGVKYDKTSMELESVEFLEFVTLKKVHKESKGPEKRGSESPIETKSRLSSRTIGPGETGYWEPNRNKNMVQQPNHRAQRNGVLGAQEKQKK